jgi:histidinol-phosphate aminotransferase
MITPSKLDLTALIGARVRGLEEYAPEPPEETARRLGIPMGQLIKLDANENPYGPTRHTLDVLAGFSQYHVYPDPISRRLRVAIGEYIGVDPATIVVGNGSDELIDLIVRLFRPGPDGGGIGAMIECPPTFGMYGFYGATNDLEITAVPRGQDFTVDVAAIEALCAADPRPRLLFLTSPNNPDGALPADEVLERLLALPLLVILDEAYVEFAGGSRVGWVAERGNLIVLRTFSKWAGLAGLRVGYGVFPAALMPSLWRLKSPYNVNTVAQAAALATLSDVGQARANIAKIVAERDRLAARLREFPFLRVYDSQANYLLCRLMGIETAAVRAAMEARGIMLRYYGGALADCVRISVGTPMQDEAVLLVFRNLMGGDGDAR